MLFAFNASDDRKVQKAIDQVGSGLGLRFMVQGLGVWGVRGLGFIGFRGLGFTGLGCFFFLLVGRGGVRRF